MAKCPPDPLNPPDVEALFGDTDVEDRATRDNADCSTGLGPQLMTQYLMNLCQQHFCDPNNIVSPLLRSAMQRNGPYRADAKDGGDNFFIGDLAVWEPEKTEKKLAIVIKDNDWDWNRMGIGDQTGVDLYTGGTSFHGHWLGSHTLFCMARAGAEARLLGTAVTNLMLWYGLHIAADLDIYRFLVGKQGGLAAIKESRENYAVPITVAYAVGQSWSVTPEAPRLKNIRFSASI